MNATNSRILWAAILASVTFVGSYGLACTFPFAALAALAALTLERRDGALLVAAIWLGNQAVGYGLLDYPWDSYSAGRGVALGVGAMAAFFAAKAVAGEARLASPRALVALATAFVVQQGVTFVDALWSGSGENYVPSIVAQVALNDALWFAGLALIKLGLDRAIPASAVRKPIASA